MHINAQCWTTTTLHTSLQSWFILSLSLMRSLLICVRRMLSNGTAPIQWYWECVKCISNYTVVISRLRMLRTLSDYTVTSRSRRHWSNAQQLYSAINNPSNASNACHYKSDIMIKKPSNALSAQQLYNDINNALNASNAQQLLSVIKNASNASNAQQLYSDSMLK